MAELLTERIRRNARELKLLSLAEDADALVERAEQAKLGYREFLDLVLEEEVGLLEGRRYAARLKLSALPHRKTLADFDLAFQPELDPKQIAELKSLRFLERRVSVLLLGPPGVGKTHLAVGLAMEALKAGYLVRYTTLDELVRELRRADQLERLREKLSNFKRPQLLCCDEMAQLHLLDVPWDVVLHRGSRLARKVRVRPADLAHEDWVLPDFGPDSPSLKLVGRMCAAAGFEPRVALFSASERAN